MVKTSDFIKALRAELVTLLSIPVSINYSETKETCAVIQSLGMSNFSDTPITLDTRAIVQSITVSIVVKGSTYDEVITLAETLEDAFHEKWGFSLNQSVKVQRSLIAGATDQFFKESRRHHATRDLTFIL
ncbi:hypothetical protein QTO01_11245 [Vibrio mytili]|uniref:hypothetical protein n=1 Tax=Vibrio mytili TaxID=50718 RepID=UPI002F4057AF